MTTKDIEDKCPVLYSVLKNFKIEFQLQIVRELEELIIAEVKTSINKEILSESAPRR